MLGSGLLPCVTEGTEERAMPQFPQTTSVTPNLVVVLLLRMGTGYSNQSPKNLMTLEPPLSSIYSPLGWATSRIS